MGQGAAGSEAGNGPGAGAGSGSGAKVGAGTGLDSGAGVGRANVFGATAFAFTFGRARTFFAFAVPVPVAAVLPEHPRVRDLLRSFAEPVFDVTFVERVALAVGAGSSCSSIPAPREAEMLTARRVVRRVDERVDGAAAKRW